MYIGPFNYMYIIRGFFSPSFYLEAYRSDKRIRDLNDQSIVIVIHFALTLCVRCNAVADACGVAKMERESLQVMRF